MKLKAAIIVDNDKITKWQKNALESACEFLDIKIVFNCTNTRLKKRLFKHGFYYILNILALKNEQTKSIRFPYQEIEKVSFASESKGSWQTIPSSLVDIFREKNIHVIIKFGMSLLRIEESFSNIPVFSYHHGDPSSYRGRPAGFYEILNNENKSGIIVQQLSNKLDAGKIYAQAYSKLYHHSYKASAINFYKVSQYLLRDAILNWQENKETVIDKLGPVYSLPRNLTVLKFAGKLVSRKARRLLYGAFFEKKWKVATTPWAGVGKGDNRLNSGDFSELKQTTPYNFYADPFFSTDGKLIRVEALNSVSGLGDIIEVADSSGSYRKLLSGVHYSYPFSFEDDGNEYVLPEVASHSSPYFLKLSGAARVKFPIKGLEGSRIVDPTLIKKDGYYFLFFSEPGSESNVLQLYVSEGIDCEFKPHRNTPVLIDPSGARMGGRILQTEEGLFRFGQDNCREYGSRLNIYKISVLNDKKYRESWLGRLSIDGLKGPHTVDVNSRSLAVVDYYEEKFSPLAGYRRLIGLLRRS